ncbi:MAG: GDCCVxC domain-containing (seleno)protein [Gammaproteobacteria bacterium]
MVESASQIRWESKLRCPECGSVSRHEMPRDCCVFFHECPDCKMMLKPKAGDCCVFCSYGDVPCPSRQAAGACI